jgi:Pentapeptide repeats (9 copies)
MCKHQYSPANAFLGRKKEVKYCEFESTISKYSNNDIIVPLDNEGVCIFHSSNNDWKIQFGFWELLDVFLTSVESLDNKKYDFCEAIFPSDQLFKLHNFCFKQSVNFNGAKFSNKVKFTDVTFEKSADFENCIFMDKVEFINTDFILGVSFKKSLLSRYFLLKNVNLDDLILSKIQAKEQVYLENVKVQKYAQFDSSTFEQGIKLSNSNFDHFVFFDNSKFYALNKNLHFFDVQNCTFKL